MHNVRIPISGFVVGSFTVPAAAKTNNHIDCQTPPTIRGTLRPNYLNIRDGPKLIKTKPADPLHDIHPPERAYKIDNSENSLRHEIVFNAHTLEDSGAVIKEVIRSSQLLDTLQGHC